MKWRKIIDANQGFFLLFFFRPASVWDAIRFPVGGIIKAKNACYFLICVNKCRPVGGASVVSEAEE